MTFIIAVVVIFFSYSAFKPLWSGIFFDIRVLFSSDARKVIKDLGISISHKDTVVRLTIKIVILGCLLSIMYFLFSRYSFGYSISALVGCFVALIEVLSDRASKFVTGKLAK